MPLAPEIPRGPIYRDPWHRRTTGDIRREMDTYQMIREEMRRTEMERNFADLSKQEDTKKKTVADLKKQEDDKKKSITDLNKQEDDKKKTVAELKKQEDDRKKSVADLQRQEDDTKRRVDHWQWLEDGYRFRRPSRSISPFDRRYSKYR